VTAAEKVVADFITSGPKTSGNKAAGGADVIENAAIYLCLAKAYALCGSLSHAKKWLQLASSAVKVTQNATLKDNMRKRFQGDAAPKETAASKSVALFLSHRRAEIQNEVQLVEDYILCVEAAATPSALISSEEFRASACVLNLRYLSQVLYFGFDGQCDADVASEANGGDNQLLVALREKFGLDRIAPQDSALYDGVSSSGSSSKIAAAFAAEKASVVQKVVRAVDASSGLIDFEQLFPQFITAADWNEEAHKAELSLPLKLEICSGNGEWVAAQAAADRGAYVTAAPQSEVKALWLALELRCDRVHNTLCQHAFSSNDLAKAQLTGDLSAPNRNNLAIIGGDASKILPSRLPPGRLSAIFVNHPQPPEQRANEKDKKKGGGGGGAHLLTVEFFAQMHRTLSAEGTITIVTDNQFYVKLLADSLVEMAQKASKQNGDGVAFVSRALEGDATRNLQESLPVVPPKAPETGKKASVSTGPSIDIWRGEPGQEAGHIAPAASSYFDRMWDLGQKKRRYFLFLGKM
jgi:tRNA G46 methylase TrmB